MRLCIRANRFTTITPDSKPLFKSDFSCSRIGSGKTYTMEGSSEHRGINVRALTELFNVIGDRSETHAYAVSVSVVEIYNEMARDLLGNQSAGSLEVRQGADGVHIPDLKQKKVSSSAEVQQLMAFAYTNRAVGSTNMNEHSSRSHCMLFVFINGTHKATDSQTCGKLILIDLAGSERVKKSEVLLL